MGLFRNPKTNKYRYAKEEWDLETGEDLARKKAIAKGYEPVQLFTNPHTKEVRPAYDTSENIQQAQEKGWLLPHQVDTDALTFGASGEVSKQDVNNIAAKHGIEPEKIDELVEFVGGMPNYREANKTRYLFGGLGRSAGANIPQFLYRELQFDPATEQAISDLTNLIEERMSGVQKGAEIAGGFLTPGGAAIKAWKQAGKAKELAKAATMGGVYGAAVSDEGEEAESALLGATLGAALSAVGGLKKAKPEKVQEDANALLKEVKQSNRGKNLDELIEKDQAKRYARIVLKKQALVDSEVTSEVLEQLGEKAVNRRFFKNFAEEMGMDTADPEIRKLLGSVDLDYDAVRLAEELGFSKAEIRLADLAAEAVDTTTDKLSKVVSQAKQYVSKIREVPGGDVEVEAAFNRMQDKQSMQRIVAKAALPDDQFITFKRAMDMVTDGKYVARAIDQRNGTNMERVILDLDSAGNKLTYILANEQQKIKGIKKAITDSGLDYTNFRSYLENPALLSGMDKAQKEAVQQARAYFDSQLDIISQLGLKIPKRENYFPHLVPSSFEKIRRVKDFMKTNNIKDVSDINLKLKPLDGAEKELVDGLQYLSGVKIKDTDSLKKAYTLALNPMEVQRNKGITEATAAFKREDKIPDFLLMNNFETAALNWVQNTYKHALTAKSMLELRRIRDIIGMAKDERGFRYVDNLIQDLNGLRVGTLATEAKKAVLKWQISTDQAIRTLEAKPKGPATAIAKGTLKVLRDAPDAWNTLLSMAYPNFLGMSPRAIIMNMTQLGTMTFPELGTRLSMRYAFPAMADLTKQLTKGQTITLKNPAVAERLGRKVGDKVFVRGSLFLPLENEGLIAKQYTQELVDSLRSDMQRSAPVEFLKDKANTYSNFAMGLFSATELLNRALGASIGKQLALDLIKKDPTALRWLTRVKGAQGRSIAKAIQERDVRSVILQTQEYILSKTILNYTRQSMNEFGRFMGPAFSMFTKWPTSVAGEVVEQYSTNGFSKANLELAKRYLAPWLALQGFGALATVAAEYTGQEERLRGLTGSRGVSAWAPITSLEALAGGEFLKSPATEVAVNVANTVFNPSVKNLNETINDAANLFVPGMSLARFFMQDIPRIVFNEDVKSFKPTREGVEFLGKVAKAGAGVAALGAGAVASALQQPTALVEDHVQQLTTQQDMFDFVFAKEGGYVDHPDDPGKATNYGITEATARAHGYTGDMKDLPKAKAKEIYKKTYWEKNHIPELQQKAGDGVALLYFDQRVNTSDKGVAQTLQPALDDAGINFTIGSNRTDWVKEFPKLTPEQQKALRNSYIKERVNWYTRLLTDQNTGKVTNLAAFWNGWLDRIEDAANWGEKVAPPLKADKYDFSALHIISGSSTAKKKKDFKEKFGKLKTETMDQYLDRMSQVAPKVPEDIRTRIFTTIGNRITK